MGLRSFLFKKRSYTPVPIVIAVIYYSEPYKPFWVYGTFLILLGIILALGLRTTIYSLNIKIGLIPFLVSREHLLLSILGVYIEVKQLIKKIILE